MKIYHDIKDLNQSKQWETIYVAKNNGYDTVEEQEDGHLWCGKHGTDEYLDVYEDGSWSHIKDSNITASGQNASMLGIFSVNPKEYLKIMES